MSYRLVAMDWDGTLVDESLIIKPRVRRALQRATERGVRVTLASGRGYPALRGWVSDLGITTPVIGYQGATVTDPLSGQYIYQQGFPIAMIEETVFYAREHSLSLTYYVDDQVYVEDQRQPDEFYAKWFGLPIHVVPDLAHAFTSVPAKFIFIGSETELDQAQPEVEQHFRERLQIVRSHRYFLEGLALGVHKGSALAWLAHRLGIAREETMAIGDSGNDIEMIAWAGLGVAMGNAIPEAKDVADYVAPTVAEDGVAEALERFLLRDGYNA
jgi:Cof subfamily protein (haloacid dehalogenase superfamily)